MKRVWTSIGMWVAVSIVAAGCGSSSDGSGTDAGVDGGQTEGGGGKVTLTILNHLSWCSVSINGGTASTDASMTASVSAGSKATIVATPASATFAIGTDPWFGVTEKDGGAAAGTDKGTGTTETSTATVVVSGNKCVSVCCQFAQGAPMCPTTDPCP